MIDRFGDQTHSFTPKGAAVIIQAREIRGNQGHQLLSPLHVGVSLVEHYKDAFGDKDTQSRVKESLLDWEAQNPAKPGEVNSLLQIAMGYARSQTGRILIRDKDILHALLMPDQPYTPPLGPLAFFRGDTDSPLSYRHRVINAVGVTIDGQYFGSPAYHLAQDAIIRNYSNRLAKAG